MPKTPWQPKTSEQEKLLQEAIEAAAAADEAEDAGWERIKRARDAGVPDEVLCKRTGWSRSTLNRRYGPRRRDDQDQS